jgi:hypothetical protein
MNQYNGITPYSGGALQCTKQKKSFILLIKQNEQYNVYSHDIACCL